MLHWRPRVTWVILAAVALVAAGCASTPDQGGAAPGSAPEQRSLGDRIADQRIRSRIMAEIFSDEALQYESNINVTVFHGTALLTGEVPDRETGRRIARLAREESGADAVYNELVIAPLSSVFARTRDSLLAAAARTRVMTLDEPEDLDAGRIRIVAERARLYLLGPVTRAEADAVVDTVRRINGVREVVRLFDYPD